MRGATVSLEVCMGNGITDGVWWGADTPAVSCGGARSFGAPPDDDEPQQQQQQRPLLYWLRSMGSHLPKKYWRALTCELEHMPSSTPPSDTAFWLYRSVISYTPEFPPLQTWSPEELTQWLPLVDPGLAAAAPLIRHVGLSGADLLGLTSADLGEYPLRLGYEQKKAAFGFVNRAAGPHPVKGVAVPYGYQLANVLAWHVRLAPDGGPMAALHREVVRAVSRLPRLRAPAVAYKAAKVLAGDGEFAHFKRGVVMSWPYVTSATTDPDIAARVAADGAQPEHVQLTLALAAMDADSNMYAADDRPGKPGAEQHGKPPRERAAQAVREVLLAPEAQFQIVFHASVPVMRSRLVVARELCPVFAALGELCGGPPQPRLQQEVIAECAAKVRETVVTERYYRATACELMRRVAHLDLCLCWLEGQYATAAEMLYLAQCEQAERSRVEAEYDEIARLADDLKCVAVRPQLSAAKANWLVQGLDDDRYVEVVSVVIAFVSCDRARCVRMCGCAGRGLIHGHLMKRRDHPSVVYHLLQAVSNAVARVGKHSEFVQHFSLPNATAVVARHAASDSIALTYLSLWEQLYAPAKVPAMGFTFGLLVDFLSRHTDPTVVRSTLRALVKVARHEKGNLVVQQPTVISWVVRRGLENITSSRLVKYAVHIVGLTSETLNPQLKDYIYQQGCGKFVLTVIEAVRWSDVVLLRQSLDAFVRLVASLEVAWRAITADGALDVINSLVASGQAHWQRAELSKRKADWVKARSLLFRAQSLLQRV
ncbi:hypothetical protein DIPPA_13665 [Diplonema papillatum]|nr:hypothetical protein DIPPA_13665 [Diplonema papillatum]